MIQNWIEALRPIEQLPFPEGMNGSGGQLLVQSIVSIRSRIRDVGWKATSFFRLKIRVVFGKSTFLYKVQKKYSAIPLTLSENFVLQIYTEYIDANVHLNFLQDAETDGFYTNDFDIHILVYCVLIFRKSILHKHIKYNNVILLKIKQRKILKSIYIYIYLFKKKK